MTATRWNLLLLMILLVLCDVKYWRHSATKLLTESLNGYCTFINMLCMFYSHIIYILRFACILKLKHSSAKSIVAGYKVLPLLPCWYDFHHIMRRQYRNRGPVNKDITIPLQTKKLINEFYQPYNQLLAHLLSDTRYLWND